MPEVRLNRASLSLGSNIDKERNIVEAVRLLAEAVSVVAVSSVYETAPVGNPNQESFLNAAVVIETKKQSVRFQQGVLGLGLGTVELVPFWKVERIEVSDFPLGDAPSHLPRPAFDLRAWDIVLVKTSGKRLSIAQVVSANQDELIDEGFTRALDAAEAIGAMVEKPVVITAAVEEERAAEAAEEPAEGEKAVPSEVQNMAMCDDDHILYGEQ